MSGFHEQWSQWSQWSHRFVQSSGNWDEAGSCIDSSTFHPLTLCVKVACIALRAWATKVVADFKGRCIKVKNSLNEDCKILQDIARYCKILKALFDDFFLFLECPRFVSFLWKALQDSYSARPVQLKAASKAPYQHLEKISCTRTGPIFNII